MLVTLSFACAGDRAVPSSPDGLRAATTATWTKIILTPAPATVSLGSKLTFTVTGYDAAGNVVSGPISCGWSSDKPAVATVSAGVATSVGVGRTLIKAGCGGVIGTSYLTVVTATTASSVTVTPTSDSLQLAGTKQLTAVARDSSGNVLQGATVTWSSSAQSVAQVNGSGLVAAVGAGSADITATAGAAMARATITVTGAGAARANGSVTFNAAKVYQKITGWEAASQSGQGTALFPQYRDQLFSLAANDLGITRIRVPLRAGVENPTDYWTEQKNGQITSAQWQCLQYTVVNDDANPGSINPAGFHFSELDSTMEQVVLPFRAKLAAMGRHLYLNLNYTAFNKSCGVPAAVHRDPQEYAEFALAAFQHLQQKYGVVPDAWEMVLEPDNNTVFTGNPTLIGQALVATAARLSAAGFHPQFIAPSSMQASHAPTMFDSMATVPGAAALVSEISYHRYGVGATSSDLGAIAQRASSYGTHSAMLEHIGADYNELIADLTQANVSAWQQFALAYPGNGTDNGSTYYLVNSSTGAITLASRARYLRQFFHYVTAGAIRVGASASQSGLTPLGFMNADGKAVMVVRASAAASFTISGLPPGTYGVTYTTASATGAAAGADQTIAGGQLVNGSIPDVGLVTIFQK